MLAIHCSRKSRNVIYAKKCVLIALTHGAIEISAPERTTSPVSRLIASNGTPMTIF
jgi:hypothetical protein